MPCCGKQRRPENTERPALPRVDKELEAMRKAGEMILLEYMGGNVGAHSVYGRVTGVRYRFSSLPGKRRQYVFAADAPYLLEVRESGKGVYIAVEPEKPEEAGGDVGQP